MPNGVDAWFEHKVRILRKFDVVAKVRVGKPEVLSEDCMYQSPAMAHLCD